MKTYRSFKASGFDALEDRVVLSHASASVGAGVLHGHKAQLVAGDFARFQGAYNSTIVPIVQDMQAAEKANDFLRAQLDGQAIRTQVTAMVNGLGDQLARQLHKKMFSRIRTVITGAPSPTTLGLASASPTPGSLQATLADMPSDLAANATAVDNLLSVYQGGIISGNLAPRSRGDFVNFEYSLNKSIGQAQNTQQTKDAVTSSVNALGTQLSKDLGAPAQGDIQSRITGSGSGVTLATGTTPASGSLMATLQTMSVDDYGDWGFINDLALAYAGSSVNF